MTWRVEPPIRVGTQFCSVISEVRCAGRAGRRMLSVHGEKRPVLVLIGSSGTVSGLEIAGARLDEDQIEARFPGAVAAFLSQTGGGY